MIACIPGASPKTAGGVTGVGVGVGDAVGVGVAVGVAVGDGVGRAVMETGRLLAPVANDALKASVDVEVGTTM